MFNNIKDYINNKIEYTKLEALDTFSHVVSAGVFGILVGMFSMLILVIASITFGFLLGQWFDNYGLGFLVLFALYLILFFVLFFFKKRIISFITNMVIATTMEALKNSESDNDEK